MRYAKVTPSGCWEWQAFKNRNGYGFFGLRPGKPVLAHRFAYQYFVGPLPVGIELHHRCKNRACVNPFHLEPVTRRAHLEIDGLGPKTHCKHGHAYDAQNTYVDKRGARFCRKCRVIRTMAWQSKSKRARLN